jgi:hypothetical protein
MLKKTLKFFRQYPPLYVFAINVVGLWVFLCDIFVGLPMIFEAYLSKILPFAEYAYRLKAKIRLRLPRFGFTRRANFFQSSFMFRSNLAIAVDMFFHENADGEIVFKRHTDLTAMEVAAFMKANGYFAEKVHPLKQLLTMQKTSEVFQISREEAVAALIAITEKAVGDYKYMSKKDIAKQTAKLFADVKD